MVRFDAIRVFASLLFAGGLSVDVRAQTTWYVDDDAPLGGDGASWNSAYRYLQDALPAATNGDEIRVAGGTYKPDQDEAGGQIDILLAEVDQLAHP